MCDHSVLKIVRKIIFSSHDGDGTFFHHSVYVLLSNLYLILTTHKIKTTTLLWEITSQNDKKICYIKTF